MGQSESAYITVSFLRGHFSLAGNTFKMVLLHIRKMKYSPGQVRNKGVDTPDISGLTELNF